MKDGVPVAEKVKIRIDPKSGGRRFQVLVTPLQSKM